MMNEQFSIYQKKKENVLEMLEEFWEMIAPCVGLKGDRVNVCCHAGSEGAASKTAPCCRFSQRRTPRSL